MDLVGLLLIGAVLVFGSVYAAWTLWAVWQEARVSAQNTKVSGGTVPATTWLQHGLTVLGSFVFFSVAVSLCFSMAQDESFAEAFGQLQSLTASKSIEAEVKWGTHGNHGALHVTRASDGQRVIGASMSYLRFNNSDLKQLVKQHPHIHWLILSGTQIDDRGLEILTRRENLEALGLADTPITDRGLAALQGHLGLRELDLTRTAISDRSLQFVASMPALEHLSLCQTNVTDGGFKALAGNASLRTLNIQETSISDGAVATLATFQSLRYLFAGKSKLSPDGIAQLQHALPECVIAQESP